LQILVSPTTKPKVRNKKGRQEAMLLLGRNLGESVVIGDNIYITFVETDKSGHKFKIAIDAPRDIKIARGELYPPDTIQHEKLSRITVSKRAAEKKNPLPPEVPGERPA